MQVFIQKIGGEFHNANTYTAWRGFEQLGAHVEFFESSQLESLDIIRETPVVGGIPVVLKALGLLGCPRPEIEALPACLHPFCGRKIAIWSLSQVREHVHDERGPLFIKPLPHDHKLFNGHVVCRFRDLIETASVPPETLVVTGEVVEFVSEFRGFIHRGEIVGFRHYRGDPLVFPDRETIENGLRAFENKPIACSMDWGVTSDGRTLLVEVNDAYSLGSYGLDPLFYAPMLRDRWMEMVGFNGEN